MATLGFPSPGDTPPAPGKGPPATQASHGGALLALVVAGAVMVVLADYAPTLVNGVLALILAGVILNNQSRWVPTLNGLVNAYGKNKVG